MWRGSLSRLLQRGFRCSSFTLQGISSVSFPLYISHKNGIWRLKLGKFSYHIDMNLWNYFQLYKCGGRFNMLIPLGPCAHNWMHHFNGDLSISFMMQFRKLFYIVILKLKYSEIRRTSRSTQYLVSWLCFFAGKKFLIYLNITRKCLFYLKCLV